jgi:hypothetical protein
LAHDLESKRLALAEAESLYTEAVARVKSIGARIAEVQEKREAITARRLDGKSTAEDAAQWAMLTGDEEALSIMLAKAEDEAGALLPNQARANLANAEAEWQRHQKQETIRAVCDRAKVIEGRLVEILGELAILSIESGAQNFRDYWSPSDGLQTIMLHSRPETSAGLRRAA